MTTKTILKNQWSSADCTTISIRKIYFELSKWHIVSAPILAPNMAVSATFFSNQFNLTSEYYVVISMLLLPVGVGNKAAHWRIPIRAKYLHRQIKLNSFKKSPRAIIQLPFISVRYRSLRSAGSSGQFCFST